MSISEIIFIIVEMIGTVAFALSGAMTGIKYKLDVFGIVLLGSTTALGGGVFRDLLIGNTPPMMFRDYKYLMAAVISALLLFLIAKKANRQYHAGEIRIEAFINIFDALGLGAFTVTGIQAGIHAGFGSNGFLLIFLALITGIGGGVIRDLYVQQMPVVFRKRIYGLADILGACLYLILYRLQVSQIVISMVVVLVVFAIRMLATKFHWNLPTAD